MPREQVEGCVEVRHPGVREHHGQPTMRRQHLGEDVESRVRAAARAVAAVHDDRDGRVGEHSPRRGEDRVPRVETADLHVHLRDPGAASSAAPRYSVTYGSGKSVAVRTAPGVTVANAVTHSVSQRAIPGLCG
jgi:hypothetical protein